MKRFFALVISYLLSSAIHAEVSPLPSEISPLASKSLLLDIANVEQSKLVVVGQHGHILTSTDAVNWQQANVPVQTTLTSVFFLNKTLGWAVGHDATILHTNDGGANWLIQQYLPTLEKPLLDIAFKNEQEGIAIGAYGMLFRTLDGGETWHSEFHSEFLLPDDQIYLNKLKNEDEEAYLDEISSILPHFNRIVIDGRTTYLVGEIGMIAKSNDFGKHWNQLDEIYQGSFFDIARTNKGNLLVAGLRGHIFRSLQNGTPWQTSPTNSTALLNDIVLADENKIFVLGNNGVLLESTDDGLSFKQLIQSDGKSLIAGTWFQNHLVVVSEAGVKTLQTTYSGL